MTFKALFDGNGETEAQTAKPISLSGVLLSIPEGLERGSGLIFIVLIIGEMFGILRDSGTIDAGLERLLLTERSYQTRGIVNPPKLVAELKRQRLHQREQHCFNRYGRAGQACHFCDSTIQVSNAGGRKIYYCPGGQSAQDARS